MIVPKTIVELNRLIDDALEENINLEYKSADALQNTDSKKKEIPKDVSAMANSAGGVIIYGVKEFDEPSKKHLPEKITPINRMQFSKEQLEQIINGNISPKIEGLRIHPISLEQPDEVVYAVEIPQSSTAHQNTKDHRYYRRYNFAAVPMLDYEIRDIMNRLKHPILKIEFEVVKRTHKIKPPTYSDLPRHLQPALAPMPADKRYKTTITLKIIPVNIGDIYAQYINYYVYLPEDIVDEEEAKGLIKSSLGIIEYYGENTIRDLVEMGNTNIGRRISYGPSRYDPVLPGLRGRSQSIKLKDNPSLDTREISWRIHADNAKPQKGSILLNEITYIEKQSEEDDD